MSAEHRQVVDWAKANMEHCRVALETPQMPMPLTEYERGRITAHKELILFIEGLYERDDG